MENQLHIQQDSARILLNFRFVLLVFWVLVCVSLTITTSSILHHNPEYLQDWRGITCILLACLIVLVYCLPYLGFVGIRCYKPWPPPLTFSVPVWVMLYSIVIVLSCINMGFVWTLYIVFGFSFSLFHGRRLIMAVCVMAVTLFTFLSWSLWPDLREIVMTILSQILPIFTIMSFTMLFQKMLAERFARDHLLQQLAQTNTELEQAHEQLAQSVAQEQELAVLRERTRLAREMHDTLGHALVLISVKLEAAQRLRERDPARCDRELESLKEISRRTMTALRASIADLRSPTLESEHIYDALQRFADQFAQRTGLQVTCLVPKDAEPLSDAVAETLWKIAQEAFTNIEKHACANRVEIEVRSLVSQLSLLIQDDGIGLPQSDSRTQQVSLLDIKGHYGLRGILERVEVLGGELVITSAQKQGTTIDILLPMTHCVSESALS